MTLDAIKNAQRYVFGCAIEHDELLRDLETIVGSFYAARLDSIAKDESWSGRPWNAVLADMVDDAVLGMDGRSLCMKYGKGAG